MSETISTPQQRPPESRDRVFARMKQLYAQTATDTPDDKRILDGMSSLIIGKTTQRAHLALIAQETERLAALAMQDSWSDEQLDQAVRTMTQSVTEDMFREHWFESTLSTPDCPIHAATYGTSMFRYDLRMLMAENSSADSLSQFGWIMFDVNALRSFKDCTSHEHTTQFLRQMVCIFVDENGSTNRMLRTDGVKAITMAAGGDEFVLYMHSRIPLTPAYIEKVITSFQEEISSSRTLKAFLDFDDERVIKTYGLPSSSHRKAFAQLTEAQQKQKLADIRSSLPEKFIPSVAGGGATLAEGTAWATERDDHDLDGAHESFQSLRGKIIQGTIDLAEVRQKKNKEAALRRLEAEDPRSYAFRLRNGENRELQHQKDELAAQLAEIRARLDAVLAATADHHGAKPPDCT